MTIIMLEKQTKKCLFCGKEFEDNRSKNKLYCSRSCKTKHHYKRLPIKTINCLCCGKKVSYEQHGKERKFCSSTCRQKYFRKFLMTKEQRLNENKTNLNRTKNNPLTKFNKIKFSANVRNFSFNISFDLFLEKFWKKECTYCGSIIDGGGIDRIDSSIGYEPDNCVPCCGTCNKMKNNLLTSDFFSHIKQIYKHSKLD